jgi:hypothetical protein
VKNIFIHLDDSSQDIQQAITKVLKKSVRINPETFLDVAVDCQSKFAHPVLCKNLVDFAQQERNK